MKTRDTAASAKVVERVEKWAKRFGYTVGRSHIAETGTVYIPPGCCVSRLHSYIVAQA